MLGRKWQSLAADLVRWSGEDAPQLSQVLTAMLGLAGPIAIGAAAGHLEFGTAAAVGGLALSGAEPGRSMSVQTSSLAYAFVAGCAAMGIGAAMSRHAGIVAIGVPAIAAIAAIIGGMSRPLARATTLFILFLIMATSFGERGIAPLELTSAFALGGAWTAGVSLVLRWLLPSQVSPQADIEPSAQPTLRNLLRRWWRSLARLSAWNYTLRISIALAAAEAIQYFWPGHHAHWIALTVAIVLRRQIPEGLTMTLQRALGTLFGVGLAALLLLWSPPIVVIVLVVAALAAVRPILRAGNYAAYAVVMTPLIILLLDLGHQPSATVILDRLVATIVGCAIVLTLDYLLWSRLFAAASARGAPPGQS